MMMFQNPKMENQKIYKYVLNNSSTTKKNISSYNKNQSTMDTA